ncbi:ROK family protein [Actinospica sp. MGRD01-02]|uniref:ROK family protein n=1 Tax=Actinospica acidithermotolerans TaxID=2828514 RepID=A0A941IHB4_9ACTN|nr:ROK family protein [Actinospica acidithermotolerans]MBR7825537.1 ROK family protein [Actinospica acidithermotolerans]
MKWERQAAVGTAADGAAAAVAAIGIDFGGTKIEAALARPDGTLLDRERLDTEAHRGPRQALERTADAVRRLEARARETYGVTVTGYGAVAPGIVQSDRILLTPNLPGWEDLALAAEVQRLLGLDRPPAVGNDVRAGALAELRFGALRGTDPGLYVSLGTGVSAAVTIGGRVLAGANQAAGEIAYIDPGAGRHGDSAGAPLEEIIGGRALGERASALLGETVTTAELFARARTGSDSAARTIVNDALAVLARSIANIAALIDPEVVVIGGGMMASADVIIPVIRKRLTDTLPFPPRVAPAHFTRDASLHGAIALALSSQSEKSQLTTVGCRV